jgi:hypothetical protein
MRFSKQGEGKGKVEVGEAEDVVGAARTRSASAASCLRLELELLCASDPRILDLAGCLYEPRLTCCFSLRQILLCSTCFQYRTVQWNRTKIVGRLWRGSDRQLMQDDLVAVKRSSDTC